MRIAHKTFWMSGVALAAVTFAGTASAADLPTRKAPPAPMMMAPPFSWTGFYVGATVGGVWGSGNANLAATQNGALLSSLYVPTTIGSGTSGWELGGEVGYNYQINNFVIGVEDDLQWMSNSRSVTVAGSGLPGLGGNLTTTYEAKMDWLGTTRARLGFATMDQDRLLLFITGGLAYGGGSASVSSIGPSGYGWYGSNDGTQVGWTIGAGAEYAFTNNWTVKAEYLYYQLQTYTYATTPNNAGAAAQNIVFSARVQPEGSIARVGVNYKF